jgi:hypothetical protein
LQHLADGLDQLQPAQNREGVKRAAVRGKAATGRLYSALWFS